MKRPTSVKAPCFSFAASFADEEPTAVVTISIDRPVPEKIILLKVRGTKEVNYVTKNGSPFSPQRRAKELEILGSHLCLVDHDD